jgi:hypothetical protein
LRITPKPTESVKKIWPEAAIQVLKSPSLAKFGFHMKPRPFITFWSGRAGSGTPRVSTRISTPMPIRPMAGMAH